MDSTQLVTATSILLALFIILILFFVFKGAQKTKSLSDYAIGSFHFSPIMVGLSLAATMSSAATFVINPGFVANYGLSGLLAFGVAIPCGMFLSFIILTKLFRKYGKEVKALTMAEWIGKRYDSKFMGLFFGLLSLLLISFMVMLCIAMTKVLSESLNLGEIQIVTVLVIFIFGYMMFGGTNSMVYTNSIQAVLMIIVAIILLTSGYEHFSEGVNSFIDKIAAIDPGLSLTTNPDSLFFRDYFEIFFCYFIIGIAAVCQPHIITKSLILKKESDVNKYLLVAILVLTLYFTVLISGLYARINFPELMVNGVELKNDDIIPTYIKGFPVYISIIIIMGLLSASLSTLESLIQSVPTSITSDVIEPLFRHKLGSGIQKEKRLILINKFTIGVVGFITLFFTYKQLEPDYSVAIFAQLGVYAYFSAAFIPVLLGIFFKNVPKIIPITASIVALLVHFSIYYGEIGWYMQAETKNPAVSATFGILSAIASACILYYITRFFKGFNFKNFGKR